MNEPEVSFVVPLYNTGPTLVNLLAAFRELKVTFSWELILVDDGSSDGTFQRAETLTAGFPAPITLVEFARNFGEHAAVLEGYRRARGKFIVNLDDDLQNPPAEAVKLIQFLNTSDLDVVYSKYATKQHSRMRNFLSWAANRCATLVLGKPPDLYLSSFRAVRRELADRIVGYQGPYPYIDGLIIGATNRIGTLEVAHAERRAGKSGYTFRKLIRLGMTLLFDFSIMPLRIASLLGITLCSLGALLLAGVILEIYLFGPQQRGWASLMGALATFSGAQLLMLGIIGEYIGRSYLTVSGKPQSLVRQVHSHRA